MGDRGDEQEYESPLQLSSETRNFLPELNYTVENDNTAVTLKDIAKHFVVWHMCKKRKVPSVELIQRVAVECYFERGGYSSSTQDHVAEYLAEAAFPTGGP